MSTDQAKQKPTKFKLYEFPTPGFDAWYGSIIHFSQRHNCIFHARYDWSDVHPWKILFLQGCFDTEAIMIAQGRKAMRANKRRKFSHDVWMQAVHDFVEYYRLGEKDFFESFFGIELYDMGITPLTAVQIHLGWLVLDLDED